MTTNPTDQTVTGGQHGDLHGGGQRQSHAQRAVGSEHRQRHDLQRHQRSDRGHLQLHGKRRAKRQRVRGRLQQRGGKRHHHGRRAHGSDRPQRDLAAQRQTVTAGATATFTAAASGDPTPSVQWMVSTNQGTSFSDISGATATTYSFTPTLAQNGDEYEAVFSNAAGSATTTAATLTVQAAPAVTTQPTARRSPRATRRPSRRRPAAIPRPACSGW